MAVKMSRTKLLRTLRNFEGKCDVARELRRELRKKRLSPEEALKRLLVAQTVETPKKQSSPSEGTLLQLGEWKVFVEEVDEVRVHPRPEDFRPEVWVNRKNKTARVRVYAGKYESTNHLNRLTYELDAKPTENGFAVLVRYTLYRSGLDFGRWREFSYLAGYDDGSSFVERVSPQVQTVEEALEWLKPAEVKKAEREGRRVYRQGDVFFVELKSKRKKITDYSLPENHRAVVGDDGTVKVVHHEHSVLILPHPHFKPVVRKVIEGRRVRRVWD
ncbi:hypothetical protein Theam_1826 (plasmid) [Thermovibrio ammonificans HB-1]|uniref:Uncharacterized protein n=1 Tax=Thermovibrio ammonificans (strain DSM 15698 / JCM 12110 / HB-1) TaxID=648996 RepID=E8T6V9_THEA1|nr:hypothetical protein [Thermovibrio ammonificans]ADU97782.1 hypothetical protein Theam_1826 [Thermovibrio ammonificans HB-1]